MASFTLTWTPVITGNVTAQRASYRQKTVGGSFLTTGFSPTNDLSVIATTTDKGSLTDNVVYEFKISNICEVGGPTDNANGIIEQIVFVCVAPSIDADFESATATVSGLPADITKVRFTLRLDADDSIISGPTIENVVAGSASVMVPGLTESTAYYFQTELYATVNGVEVISSDAEYLNAVCGPYDFSTEASPVCPAPLDLEVTSTIL